MNYLRNQDKFLRVEQYLGSLLEDAKNNYDWDPSRMKIMPGALYANKKVEFGGSSIDLLEGDSQSVRGITNFDGRLLAKGRVFVADGISFGWKVADSDTAVHNVEYDFTTLPTYLQYANLVLKQSDETLIKLPLISIISENGRGNDSNVKELGAFSLIEDNVLVDFSIELPRGAAANLPDGESLFVSALIRGSETFTKR